MIWDFTKDSKPLDDIFKTTVKTYITSQKKFQDINITYNDTALIEKEQNGVLTLENKGYDGLTERTKPVNVLLQKWIGDKMNNGVGWDDIDSVQPNDFVDFYKKNVGPIFNVDETLGLNLGAFKISLNYFNIYGLGLFGNITNKDNEDATITVNLSQGAINKKLASWGKIIIQFIKYARGGTFSGKIVELRVPNKIFKKVLEQNRKDGLKSVIAFLVKDFKFSEEANDLEDLDLFNIKLHSALGNPKGEQNWNNDLTWTAEVWTKWAVMFTFGESFDNGLYYSFASK
ncbi:hypothetical protein [Spiroplasma poulsonii]|uniref:Uncharacterized protein n=1 Tax=Spiroplasma poulsonii TaxID=2138 RepID=A0A2P6FFF1_9MOLU|nr:hypothetical protein [Spiroplasma poulsonii]KAF0850013.1 hypothetical protein MSROBK_021200 [Spiroplasma poulsonii]PQM32190.1 hypothetical protein SMSRO_SF020920 [Spiroplasma poulsonii]PWF94836.1 hypothetical protein SMSE_02600 [Spiroplasma poulsonii]PWF97635.1 hypothetical protein SMH99_01840 [Spiroplasma poulsonii]